MRLISRRWISIFFWMFSVYPLFAFSQTNEPATANGLRVEEIRILGQKSLVPRDLETVLPIATGDRMKSDTIASAKKRITAYYEKRGFYRTKISIELQTFSKDQTRIIVNVDEGEPCLIRSFSVADPPPMNTKFQFQRFKDRIYRVANVEIGTRYDEEQIADKLRNLQEFLVGQDFFLANTDEVKLSFNEDRTEVDVHLAIQFGERLSFGFQGNTVFSKGELNDFIKELRTSGLSKDYVNMIAKKIIDEYKLQAHNDAQVTFETSEKDRKKHITFFIDEGKRAKLSSIKWEGLSVDNAKKAEQVFSNGVTRYVKRGYYIDKEIEKGISLVLEDLRFRGYLSVKLVSKSVLPVETKQKEFKFYAVTVQLSEGEQTSVGTVQLSGFTHFEREHVLKALNLKEGEPFNPFGFEDGIQKLKFEYLRDGFLEFRYTTAEDDVAHFTSNNRVVNIKLEASEGPHIRLGKIKIFGLEQTKLYVVEREILLNPGDYWQGDKLREMEQNLRRLGVFSDVRLRAELTETYDVRDLIIDLKEGQPGSFEAGPGFRSDLGIRAFSRVSYSNLFGKNWIGSLGAEVNRRVNEQYRFIEYKLDSAFIEPRFFGTKYLYSIGVSVSKQRFPPDFNAATARFSTGFERRFLTETLITKLYYKIERIRQFDVFFNGIKDPVDNQTLLIGSLNPSITYDTRDSPFITTKGQVSTIALEYADPKFLGKDNEYSSATGYYKWNVGTHWYFPLTKDITWSNVAAGGFERSNIFNRQIPLIKLFRLGGFGSIRGYSEDSINVDQTLRLNGTLTYLNFRTQIDLPFVGEIKFAPFLDAGNLFIDNNFGGRPFLRAGCGAGLHYLTPIGPINLDYGIKLNPRVNDDATQIHFSVGFI